MMLTTPARPVSAERLLHPRRDRRHRSHISDYGPLPRIRVRDPELLAEIAASGITGRGGSGFPTATKLTTVGKKRWTSVVANGTESEPASSKDVTLMIHNPHLVLDGLQIAARLVGAREATLAVAHGSPAHSVLVDAIAERPESERPRLLSVEHRFVSGEESALVSALRGGVGLPTGQRPFARGILVQNVETLANVALVARYGATWFRSVGPETEPGTALATVSGAVAAPGVLEFEFGTTLGELFARCGGVTDRVDAVLIGGYFGRWLRADENLVLSSDALRERGGSLGGRVFVALPRSSCGLIETARVVRYMAGESAGQCGPCLFGLQAVADAFDAVVDGRDSSSGMHRLDRLHMQIARRGACHHPDGTLGFVASALVVFGEEIARHSRGVCSATSYEPVLRTPHQDGGDRYE